MERKRHSLKDEISRLVKKEGELGYEEIAERLGIDLSPRYKVVPDCEGGYIRRLKAGAGRKIWKFSGALDDLVREKILERLKPLEEGETSRSIYRIPSQQEGLKKEADRDF